MTSSIQAPQLPNPPAIVPKPRSGRQLALRQYDDFATVKAQFADPDIWYAPHIFYFFMGDVASADLRGQANEMCDKRMNPGYIHMRQYPNGFWMTDTWFDAIGKTLETAKDRGAYACFTAGDPSVPQNAILAYNPDLAIQSLRWTVAECATGETVDLSDCLYAVVARRTGSSDQPAIVSESLQIVEGGQAAKWIAPDGNWRTYKFSKYRMREPEGLEINLLDRRVGDAWIAVELDKYPAQVGEYLGTTMPGGFIDLEGDYGTKLAYSDDLAAEYMARNGRDIRLWLPLLIDEDVEGLWGKARWDWFKAASTTYLDELIKPLDRWFEQYDMYMTCHFWEENLVAQAMRTGDYFEAQRSYSLPGTDALFMGALRPCDFKETQAVSEFEGRQFMCELLGVGGWHISPADIKNATNHAIAWGVTHIVPHGIYSDRDLRKVNYPPDFFDWNPYWRHFDQYTDYCRRASFINAQGHVAADVLLLCPMDSVWSLLGDGLFDADKPYKTHIVDQQSGIGDPECMVDARHGEKINEIERAYTKAMTELVENRNEFLITDAEYLRSMELVEDGTLHRESYSFGSIVLPPLVMLPLDIATLLLNFAQNDGNVYALGSLPHASTENGMDDPQMRSLMEALAMCPSLHYVPDGIGQLVRSGQEGLQPHVKVSQGDFPLIQQHRVVDGRDYYWLVNPTAESQTCRLNLHAVAGTATRWDCETGQIDTVETTGTPEGLSFGWTFAPFEAFWLVVDPNAQAASLSPDKPRKSVSTTQLDGEWRVWFNPSDQPNPAQHKQETPAWMHGTGEMRPLSSWLTWGLRDFSGFIDYECGFTINEQPSSAWLDLGSVKHIAEVWVNDQFVGARIWPAYRFNISDFVRRGYNIVHVRIGNLVLNAVTQYENYNWRWYSAPEDTQLDAGLFGPAKVEVESVGEDVIN